MNTTLRLQTNLEVLAVCARVAHDACRLVLEMSEGPIEPTWEKLSHHGRLGIMNIAERIVMGAPCPLHYSTDVHIERLFNSIVMASWVAFGAKL